MAKRQFVDFLMTMTTYYGNGRFTKIDLSLLSLYLRKNPFRISRQFLQCRGEKGEALYTYGETPLTTLHLICRKAGITKEDTVLELGCGRGRTCFWLHEWIGCQAVGIEQVTTFVENANWIKSCFDVTGVTFLAGDYQTLEWGQPSVVYLYASNLSDAEIEALVPKFRALPKGTKIISVSYPIPGTGLLRRFQVPFTWGEADVFVAVV